MAGGRGRTNAGCRNPPLGGLIFIHIFSVKKFWKSESEVICMLQMFNALVSPPFEGGGGPASWFLEGYTAKLRAGVVDYFYLLNFIP